jgi:hypothetical protein
MWKTGLISALCDPSVKHPGRRRRRKTLLHVRTACKMLALNHTFSVWFLLYAHRHRSILGAFGHIIPTPANQLMIMGLKI